MKIIIAIVLFASLSQAAFVDGFLKDLKKYKQSLKTRVSGPAYQPPTHTETEEHKLFTAKNSTEATMKFNYEVLYSANSAAKSIAREQIEAQLKHMFGPMSHNYKLKAVPLEDHKITKIKVTNVTGNHYKATYSYRGSVQVQKSNSNDLVFPLPKSAQDIYQQGIVVKNGKQTFPCTDSHYTSEGDFWYFWDPKKWNCPLSEGAHYDNIKASIKRKSNMKVSYPDYKRLIRKSGDIEIMMFFGMDKPEKYSHDPRVSKDVNAYNYVSVTHYLASQGFKPADKFSKEQMKKILGVNKVSAATEKQLDAIATIERFYKKTPKGPIYMTMYFGPTGISEQGNVLFHAYYAWALENASIMMYQGHSGLGGHLDLAYIDQLFSAKYLASGKINLNNNQYQIYYFNSCSSYPYYNEMYFSRKKNASDKKGTKNLDIITNGLATYFSVMDDTVTTLLRMVIQWSDDKYIGSWQDFVAQADSQNLLGVNGDRDNPTSPAAVK